MNGVLFVADLHAGRSTHDGPMPQGTIRQNEVAEVLGELWRRALRYKVDTIIFLGDTFDSKRPPAWAYKLLLAFIAHCRTEQIQVILMPGNHDWYEDGRVSPLRALSEAGASIQAEPAFVRGVVNIAFLPWFGRASVAARTDLDVAGQHRYMAEAAERIIADLAAQAAKSTQPTILCLHNTVAGASYNSDTQPLLGESGEFILPLPAVHRSEFAAVLCGHVHKPQIIAQDHPIVMYVGGATRGDFGEEKQPCQVIIAESVDEGITLEPVAISSALRFRTLPADVSVIDAALGDLSGQIVRFKGELPAGPESAALLRDLEALAVDCGALRVAKPAVQFIRHEARGEHTMTVEQAPEAVLTEYVALVGGEYAEREPALLEIHRQLIEEVGAHGSDA